MSIEENIIPGKILYLNVCFPHESEYHNKYIIVVGIGTFPLLLKINTSEQQPEIAKRFKERQFKIKRAVYTFLDHDSFVDCGTVWATLIKTEDVVQQLLEDPTRIKGDVQEYHKNEIVRLINLSRSIEPRHKRTISDALGKK